MRAAGLIEDVLRLLDRRSGLYSVYSDAISKFKSGKDATAFANARKKLDGDYRSISNQVTQIQGTLSKERPEAGEKVKTWHLCRILLSWPKQRHEQQQQNIPSQAKRTDSDAGRQQSKQKWHIEYDRFKSEVNRLPAVCSVCLFVCLLAFVLR